MNRLIIFQLVCALLRICSVFAFTRLSGFNGIIQRARSSLSLDMSILNRPRVNIYDTADVVGIELCNQFILSAKTEIKSKGAFYVAVPGGSALKLLKGLKDKKKEIDWSKVFLFYVNHKCVPNNDESATHFKAKNLFLDAVGNVNAFVLDENKPNPADVAASYEQLVKQVVPQKNGLPYFDLVLLGFGKDGHIGSLYPGRNEVTNTSALVLAVDKVCLCQIYRFILVQNILNFLFYYVICFVS